MTDEISAQEIISELPQDLHHVSLESLLPLIALLMTRVQEIGSLDGPAKQKLVMSCLDRLIERLPFPENKILEPVVHAIAPGAIAGILAGSKYAEKHCKDIIKDRRADRMRFFGSLTLPSRTLFRFPRRSNTVEQPKLPPKISNRTKVSMGAKRPQSLLLNRSMVFV